MSSTPTKLFGTDGIRARYGEEPLSETSIRRIGAAIGKALAQHKVSSRAKTSQRVLVGRDTRASGPAIGAALADGLNSAGYNPVDLGIVTTPGVAYCVRNLGAAAGIVISASHNAAEDNGIKIFGPDAFKLADEIEDAIGDFFHQNDVYAQPQDVKTHQAHDHVQAYQEHLLASARNISDTDKPFAKKTLVIDCAHGAATPLAPALFRELGAEVIEVGCAPDGNNINQQCGALYPEALSQAVRSNSADAGITFDGDGDRVMLLDHEGQVLDGDHILAILARSIKEEGKLNGNKVVGTVMANLGLELSLKEIGVELIREAVGDRYVVARMLSDDIALGGEQSGHIIHFTRGSTTGDGIFTALNLLSRVWRDGATLFECAKALKKYPQILINVKVKKKPPLAELKSVARALKELESALGDQGRVVLRYSGTETLARVMVEGPELSLIEKHAGVIADAIKQEIGHDG